MHQAPHSCPRSTPETPLLRHRSFSPQVYDSCGGDQAARRAMRASLLLAPQRESPLHCCWGHYHAVLSPPHHEMLRGSPPCGYPACSQSSSAFGDRFGQHEHALQHGLARPAAKGRTSGLVKHRIWSGATSAKHGDASLFRQVLPLRRCRDLG